MLNSPSFEERQIINITNVQDMSLVEVRARPPRRGIITIDETPIEAIRRVVNRVSKGISKIQLQTAYRMPHGEL